MRWTSLASVFGFVLLAAITPAAAELTPDQRKTAETLVAQFTAREFAVRQAAVEKLIALGPDVVPLVKKTLAETADNEVKLRCEMTLKGIADRFGVRIDGVKSRWKVNAEPSRVTLHVKGQTLAEVLRMLSEQTGNRPPHPAEGRADERITLDLDGVTYWEALARICSMRGLALADSREPKTRGPELVPGNDPDAGTNVGPVTVRVRRLTCTMRTTFLFGARGGEPESETVELHGCRLITCWETRLPVVNCEIELTRVALDGEKDFVPASRRSTAEPAIRISPWTHFQDFYRGVHEIEMDDVPKGTSKLASVEGLVRLTLGTEIEEHKMEDVLVDRAQSVAGDGVVLNRAAATREGETVTVKLAAQFTEEAFHAHSMFLRDSALGLFLVTSDGKRRRPDEIAWQCTPRTPARRGEADFDPRSGTLTLRFDHVPPGDVRAEIRFLCPTDVEVQEFRFSMQDVPTW